MALILRLSLAAIFIPHGAGKLFGAFGGDGLDGTAAYFESLGLTPGDLWAPVAGCGELLGGLLMLFGLLTPLAALDLIVVMVVAAISANQPFFGGWELNLALGASAAAVLAGGPGRYSLDEALGLTRRWSPSRR
jgi:putative oxidoreductase